MDTGPDLCEMTQDKVTGKLAGHCRRKQDSVFLFLVAYNSLPTLIYLFSTAAPYTCLLGQSIATALLCQVSLEHSSQFLTANAPSENTLYHARYFQATCKECKIQVDKTEDVKECKAYRRGLRRDRSGDSNKVLQRDYGEHANWI